MKLIKELKSRKIKKYFTIYLSTCITAIGFTHLLSLRYHLPTFIFDSLLIFVVMGILSVFIFAWFHGKENFPKTKPIEYILHSIIFIFAFTISYVQANKGPIKILNYNSKTIAVLPFSNLSDSKEDEYFSDGITDDILTQLSKISELKVISRTSVMKYKNSNLTIPQISSELGAGSILEGSVRRSKNKFRITAQLINANTDEHIWAKTYDRKIDDIFKVQSEIAINIANELEARLAPKEKILIDTKPTNNIEAYALCLKGRQYAAKYTDQNNEKAIEYYKKALAIDPNYALAYASLASAYDQKVRRYLYPENWRDSAIVMSNKALLIDPYLAEGHSSLAKSYEAKENYKLAKYHYEEAIRLNPNYYAAIYNLGVVNFNEGKLDKAFKLINKSILLQPDNTFGYIVMGGIYQKLACDKAAIKWFKKALELEPNNSLVYIYLIDQCILTNKIKKANEYFDSLKTVAPNWPYKFSYAAKLELLSKNYKKAKLYYDKFYKLTGFDYEYNYGFILLQLGNEKEGKNIVTTEIANYENLIEENPNCASQNEQNLANMFSILGNKKESLIWLDKAVNKGWIEYRTNLVYPFLETIKNTDKFRFLINKMKTKIDSIKLLLKENDVSFEECN